MNVHNWLNLTIHLEGDEKFMHTNHSGFKFICTRVHMTLGPNEDLENDLWIQLDGPGVSKADGRILSANRHDTVSIHKVPWYVEKVIREKAKKMEALA